MCHRFRCCFVRSQIKHPLTKTSPFTPYDRHFATWTYSPRSLLCFESHWSMFPGRIIAIQAIIYVNSHPILQKHRKNKQATIPIPELIFENVGADKNILDILSANLHKTGKLQFIGVKWITSGRVGTRFRKKVSGLIKNVNNFVGNLSWKLQIAIYTGKTVFLITSKSVGRVFV